MKQSLTYHITLFIIKLKGLKKDFSKDPMDYKKIRKEDVHQPKGSFFKKNLVRSFRIKNSTVSEIKRDNSQKLLIFIHGGAFISGPSKIHWDTIKTISKQTNLTIWMCDYPKAPENKITEISRNIDSIYQAALNSFDANQISFLGDSVGGTLIAALMQRLIKNNIEKPNKIILVSPVMDASLSNPDIERIDKTDPMLSKKGILSAKKMCADTLDLKNEMISPLYGSFEGFPKTVLFLSENDIMFPDGKLVEQKMRNAYLELEVITGENMPHIWPFLPVMKEAKTALGRIINFLNE